MAKQAEYNRMIILAFAGGATSSVARHPRNAAVCLVCIVIPSDVESKPTLLDSDDPGPKLKFGSHVLLPSDVYCRIWCLRRGRERGNIRHTRDEG